MNPEELKQYVNMPLKVGVFSKKALDVPRYDEAVRILCQSIPLNCTEVPYDVYSFGTVFENGTATMKFKDLQDGVVDTFPPDFTPTATRLKAIDFADTLYYADVLLITRAPILDEADGLSLSMFTMVKWQVWLVFISAILLTSCVMGFMALLMLKTFGGVDISRQSHSTVLMEAFSSWPALVTHKHSEKDGPVFDSFRFTIACWSLAIMVLSASYTGMLFSDNMKVKDPLPFDSVDTFAKCMEEGRCRLAVTSNTSSTFTFFLSAEGEIGRRVRKTFDQRPLILKDNTAEVLNYILTTEEYFVVYLGYSFFFSKDYEKIKKKEVICPLYMIPAEYSEPCTFPVRKNSSMKRIINWVIKAFNEFDLTNPISSRNEFDTTTCNQKYFRTGRGGTDNSMFYTATAFMGGSLVVSALTLALEIFSHRCIFNRKSKDLATGM